MRLSSARIWLVLGCAGCAQLAGFEDLSGAGAAGSGAASGDRSSTGGASAGGGRAGASAGFGPVQSAGSSSDGGDSSNVDGGTAGDADGGRDPISGGSANGGSSASGNGNGGAGGGGANGGSANGGSANGGMPTGGAASGGTVTGGTGTGGTATGACGELLVNGDFASGDSGWTVDSSYANLERDVHPIIAARDDSVLVLEGVEPYSDDYLAWVGGVPDDDRDHVVSFSQTVIIPAGLTELAFSGMVRIQTDEPENDLMYDQVFIELWDLEEEERVWQFTRQSNQQAGDAWVEIDPIDPHPSDLSFIRGRTLRFRGNALTDETGPTHFFFDSLSLIAICDE